MAASTSSIVTLLTLLYGSSTVAGTLTFTSQPIPLSSAPTRLSCAAAAESLPDIIWYKDDKIIPGSVLRRSKEGVALGEMVSTLDIPCTEGIHVYTCVAYAGEAVLSSEKSVVLPEDTCTDMSGNEETIQKWYSNIMVEIGAPIVLPCDHVSGRHRSHVSWTRDGYNILELSERVHVASDGGLVIEAADWADMGVYTCTIGGKLDSVDTFLYPLTPDFPAVVGRK